MSMELRRKHNLNGDRQSGFALVIVLIFMVVLTLLGVSGMTTTRMHEQITGARHERIASLATAQAALADGRDFVIGPDDLTAAGKVQTINEYFTSTNGGWTIAQWVKGNTNWISGSYAQSFGAGSGITYPMYRTNGLAVSRNPTFIVQDMGDQGVELGKSRKVYRVTARGEGGNPENAAYLQTIIQYISLEN
jgi:type IV pilus assembly protein PilX